MKIGWIDFSDSDRKKALDVIRLLDEPGAVDEIGIGIVRDAFANKFFPGTSTIQTRAKYFYIVPYAIKKALSNKSLINCKRIISEIEDKIEYQCGKALNNGSDKDGVIGKRNLPKKWVSRKPSSIYWNGLKTFGIFRGLNLSLEEYIRLALQQRDKSVNSNSKSANKNTNDVDDFDDDDAGNNRKKVFWNLPDYDEKDWMKNLVMALEPQEAQHLRKQISENLNGTLFKFLLDNNIKFDDVNSFETLTNKVFDQLSDINKELVTLANLFNIVVYLCRIRYNIILLGENFDNLKNLWDNELLRVEELRNLDIDYLFSVLKLTDQKTKFFLKSAQECLLARDFEKLDEVIIRREKSLKGNRAKLAQKNEFDSYVGLSILDYRLGTTIKIINDIYKTEEQQNA